MSTPAPPLLTARPAGRPAEPADPLGRMPMSILILPLPGGRR
ncbi:hypothetical protein [Acrocarpospora phusangensis]|nr:hypothetical protein [Acrocarpospora phusangensis]